MNGSTLKACPFCGSTLFADSTKLYRVATDSDPEDQIILYGGGKAVVVSVPYWTHKPNGYYLDYFSVSQEKADAWNRRNDGCD